MARFPGPYGFSCKLAIAAAALFALAGSFAESEVPAIVDEPAAAQVAPPAVNLPEALKAALEGEPLKAAPQAVPEPPPLDPKDIARVNAVGPRFVGESKPGGRRFTDSAARYADVKRDVRIPRTAAKRADDEPIAGLPTWLRLSTADAVEESLRTVPEVGLPAKAFGAAPVAIERPETAGLPLVKNEERPVDDKRTAYLAWTAQSLRGMFVTEPKSRPTLAAFFQDFRRAKQQLPWVVGKPQTEPIAPAIVDERDTVASIVLPGLTQILAVQDPQYRLEIVRRISEFPAGDDAAIAVLVRMALFDADAEVREAARLSLVREPAARYGPKLLDGLRYPLPVVAERAAQAIVALDRVELTPKLVELLDEPDPSAPQEREVKGKKIVAIREVVRINHHRNCTVCHPATKEAITSTSVLVASVPSPDGFLPSPLSREYYASGRDATVVTATATYLRQDFSMLQPVADHGPWPEMQRFDYVVRTRLLTAEQAKEAKPAAGDVPSPHRRAVLYALTRLTSIYPGPEAADWRPEIQRRYGADGKLGR